MSLDYYREEAYTPHSIPALEAMRQRAEKAKAAYYDYQASAPLRMSAEQGAERTKLQHLWHEADQQYLANQQTHYRYGKPRPAQQSAASETEPYGNAIRQMLK